ncbi:MAG: arsenate reductase ArsC [Chlorobiaceae bacterium]|jgi:arsenate reductase (thioredoxin)|nr:arsenate reductase ArsC [Chlorobiaceae bacterium]NTV16816.1 arsenate reductase ArsC [Chlorobiaceae bacterium]
MKKQNVLFLCTGNSCRSQMAEGLLRHLAGEQFEALSAGLEPNNEVHPLAIIVMEEIGIDISSQQPKAVDVYLGKTMIHYLMIVCNKAQSTCPRVWPGLPDEKRYYWPVDDPAVLSSSTEEQLVVFREVRDELQGKITSWLNDVSASASFTI